MGLLAWGGVLIAQSKPSLIGATRDQVLARFGEPKSNIVAGDREVLFFSTERVVLRANRVVEVEDIEPAPTPPKPPAFAPVTADKNAPAKDPAAPLNPSQVVAAAAAAAAAPTSPVTTTTGSAANVAPATPGRGTEAASTANPTAVTAPPAEPEVIIKSVRPPSSLNATPVPPASTSVVAPPSPTPNDAPRTETVHPAATTPMPVPGGAALPQPAATVTSTEGAPAASQPTPVETPSPAATAATAPAEANPATAVTIRTKPHPAGQAEMAPPSLFTAREYAIDLLIIVGGAGYLAWRRRNRQLMLAASAVSQPFAAAPVVSSGGRFTAEMLSGLEWKRFEELVAAYYNKTGVVATRTNQGPSAAVHIRISWKGEPRPFAYVHCVARPDGLVGPDPVQSLCEVLAAEDIRRGYVVSVGKFSVPARDLAEEKHVTLLSGDIFLEKLNALPDPARAELMRTVAQADAATATCPKCDIKMMRSPTDASAWQCAQCGTTLPRG